MTARFSRNVSLTPELDDWIEGLIASGAYASASEIMREGLRLLRDRADSRTLELETIRSTIRTGMTDLHEGRIAKGDASEVIGRALRAAQKQRHGTS